MLSDNFNELVGVGLNFQAEQAFLKSKPTCFLVLGKPGVGKTTLARSLASEWRCQFINGNYSYFVLPKIHVFEIS